MDDALAEIDRLPGKHLYFLDDHLFANPVFAAELFTGMQGMGRVWQGAATVESILKPGLLEKAVDAGLKSVFIGFETINFANLRSQHKYHNLNRDYHRAIQRLRDYGVMVNASFVYGMDNDDATVFSRTVEWAIQEGLETATFHILTPYPGTALYTKMVAENRLTVDNWDLYDTRHVVYRPALMTPEILAQGYWQSYRDFYRWDAIWQGAKTKDTWRDRFRHLLYSGAWKKAEPIWDILIRLKQVNRLLPMLENVLNGFNSNQNSAEKTADFLMQPDLKGENY